MTDARPPKRRYVRVYYIDLQADYPEVWFDPTCLSTWLRLLVLADQAWPANAELPKAVRRADLERLSAVGLVTMIDRNRYAMKGYEAERTERAGKARFSVSHRYERSTNVDQTYNESSTDDLPVRAGASAPLSLPVGLPESNGVLSRDEPETPVLAYLASVGAVVAPNGNGFHRRLVLLVERQGSDAVVAAMKARYAEGDRTDRQLVLGAENELEQIHRPKSKAKGLGPSSEEVSRAFGG